MRIILLGLARLVPALGAILLNLFVARTFPLIVADIFFIWFAIFYAASFITKLGFDVFLLREVAAETIKAAGTYKRWVFSASFLMTVALFQFATSDVIWLLFGLPFFSVAALNSSITRAQGKDVTSGLLEVSSISAVSFILLLILNYFSTSISLEIVCQSFFAACLIVFFVGEYLSGYKNTIFTAGEYISNSILLAALSLAISPFVIYCTQWVAVFFLKFGPVGEVSLYSVGVRLASAFAFVTITVDAFVAPRFARLLRKGAVDEVNTLIRQVRNKASWLMIFALSFYAAVGWYIAKEYLSQQYIDSLKVSIIIAFYYLSVIIIGPYQYLLLMAGKAKIVNYSNGLVAVLVLVSSVTAMAFDLTSAVLFACFVTISRIIGMLFIRRSATLLLADDLLAAHRA